MHTLVLPATPVNSFLNPVSECTALWILSRLRFRTQINYRTRFRRQDEGRCFMPNRDRSGYQ